jgi:hypothetical protein
MSEAGFFDDIFDMRGDDPLLQPEGDGDSNGGGRHASTHESTTDHHTSPTESSGGSGRTSREKAPAGPASDVSARESSDTGLFPSGGSRRSPDSPFGDGESDAREDRVQPVRTPIQETASDDSEPDARDQTVTERTRVELAPRRQTRRYDLDDVNRALRRDWRLHAISPSRSCDPADPVFVVTLERDLPRSLFDFGGAG